MLVDLIWDSELRISFAPLIRSTTAAENRRVFQYRGQDPVRVAEGR